MTGAASEYARALYALAREEGLEDRLLRELFVVKELVRQNPDLLRILAVPSIPKAERCGILDSCFAGRMHPYGLNLMKIMTEKGLIRHFPACCDAYQALYNEDHGILTVRVVTAAALTPQQRERLKSKLAHLTGKEIDLRCREDPACLGGLRLDYDGKRVDGTVRRRLDAVRSMLESAVI